MTFFRARSASRRVSCRRPVQKSNHHIERLEARCVLDSTVVFSEIMYHPPNDAEGDLEWIELQNQLRVDMDISEWRIEGGVDFTFPDGTTVPGRGQLVVAANPEAFSAATGSGSEGPWRGRLSNRGETLRLFNNDNRLMNEVSYGDRGDWPHAPDGSGASLAKEELTSASHLASNWTFSAEQGGTPGEVNEVEPGSILRTVILPESAPATAFVPSDDQLGTDWIQPDFDDSEWLQGLSAVGFENRSALTDSLLLDLANPPDGQTPMPMYRVNTSAYVRVPFEIDGDVPGTGTLMLQIRYDDGFVAYINGTEVASSNAPGRNGNEDPLTWSSVAAKTRRTTDVLVQDSFDISEFRDVLVPGRNVLSIHGLNRRLTDSDFWVSPSIVSEQPLLLKDRISLVLNEIAAIDDADFFVEIMNTGEEALTLDQFVVATGTEPEIRIPLSDGTVLQSGERLVVRQDGFRPNEGELVVLKTSDGQEIVDVRRATDRLEGRSTRYDGQWFYPHEATPGSANSFAWQDDIVINEIMYHAIDSPAFHGLPATVQRETILAYDWDQWLYNASGEGLEPGWWNTRYGADGETWLPGQGVIGFDSSELVLPINTELDDPQDTTPQIVTYYFQTAFEITADQFQEGKDFELWHFVDSGAAFYLNGQELNRFRLAEDFDAQTLAVGSISNAAVQGPVKIPRELLRVGENILSAEVHVGGTRANDIAFGVFIHTLAEDLPAVPNVEFSENREEWIELYNRGSQAVDLTGWTFDQAVEFEFPSSSVIQPGEYVVVARDAAVMAAKYPHIAIAGSFSGRLGNRTDRIRLLDRSDNLADEVNYHQSGRWPEAADGGGSSLELRDPDADNRQAEAWAASDETTKSEWKEFSYRGMAERDVSGVPATFNEFLMGLLDTGEFLIDDVVVLQNPDEEALSLLQNGDFEGDALGEPPQAWRVIGNHSGTVVTDPADPKNQVLHVVASGVQAFLHDHAETTFADNTSIIDGFQYEVSFRLKWLSGSSQLQNRLFFNRLANTVILDVPDRNGTPGALNSQWESNAGPTFNDMSHFPVTPEPTEDVTISVEIHDPDQVASVVLHWHVDGEETETNFPWEEVGPLWNSTPMKIADDGRYAATLPPQPEATIVQFYVEAVDEQGAVSQFPVDGPTSRALYQVEDYVGPPNNIDRLRIILMEGDHDGLFSSVNRMSNRYHPITFLRNSQIFYDVDLRLVGSPFIRPRSGFKVKFHSDQALYGVHDSIRLDLNGLHEIVLKQMLNRAGRSQNSAYDDIAFLVGPRGSRSQEALLSLARYETIYLNEQFENGGDGTRYELESVVWPKDPLDGVEGLKQSIGQRAADIGVDKVTAESHVNDPEFYRGHLLLKNNRTLDDFGAIAELAQALHQEGDALFVATNEKMDVDKWMRHYANQSFMGNWDTYGVGSPRNARLYVRPTDNKFVPLFWDCDLCSFNNALIQHGNGSRLAEIRDIPHNLRLYWGHMLDLIKLSFNAEYVERWAAHYNTLTSGRTYGRGMLFLNVAPVVGRRAAEALVAIEEAIPRVDFGITTPEGTEFDEVATIRGRGWIDVRNIRLAGDTVALDVFWPQTDEWEVRLPVNLGENVITLEAIDWDGNLVETQSVTVKGFSSHPVFSDLRISELHYHPADPTPGESAAGFDSGSFEFIELVNIGDTMLDLSGVQFEKTKVEATEVGVDFAFATSQITTLEPGAHVLVVEDVDGFAARYGGGLPVAGQWRGRLSNNRETLTLTFNGQLVQQFTYEDAWYPETDGNGPSLERIDAAAADLSLWGKKEGWQPSSFPMGSPGVGNEKPPIAGDSNRDGVFDEQDLAFVFAAGKYEDGVPNNASFEEGDWDGDGDFTSHDIVFAFTQGYYRPSATSIATDLISSALDAKRRRS